MTKCPRCGKDVSSRPGTICPRCGDVYKRQVIYCERDSHKGTIIGKNGRKLKGIGKSARADIELLLGSQANLQLWVNVKENWRNLQNYVSNFGYTEK